MKTRIIKIKGPFKQSKLGRTLVILKNWQRLVGGESYYPNDEHKTNGRILLDQLYFLWKYGCDEPFYFLYGFDRKKMNRERIAKEYLLPFSSFQKKVEELNQHNPKYKWDSFIITWDKFLTGTLLESFDIPTPHIYCYIKDGQIHYMDPQFNTHEGVGAYQQLAGLLSGNMSLFCKPSCGALGNDVFSLDVRNNCIYINDEICEIDDVIDRLLSDDYIIQEKVYQHSLMNKLNDSSVNTIRILTVMRKDGSVLAFGAGLRIGRRGSSVDNWSKGGIFVGIDMEQGRLMEKGFLKPQYGTVLLQHPDTLVTFKNFEIPYFKEVVQLVTRSHEKLYWCHSLGWDVAITDNGPVIIEANSMWEVSLIQAAHGGLKEKIGGFFLNED